MKKVIAFMFLSLTGCAEPISEYQKGIDESLVCSWSPRYSACFCSAYYHSNFGVLTWAPDKVCGK